MAHPSSPGQIGPTLTTDVRASATPISVNAVVTPANGTAPLTVNFTAQVSGGVPPYTLEWSVNSQILSTNLNGSKTLSTPGSYTFGLTVIDSQGNVGTGAVTVVVLAPASPPDIIWVVIGAAVAAVVGGTIGILASRPRGASESGSATTLAAPPPPLWPPRVARPPTPPTVPPPGWTPAPQLRPTQPFAPAAPMRPPSGPASPLIERPSPSAPPPVTRPAPPPASVSPRPSAPPPAPTLSEPLKSLIALGEDSNTPVADRLTAANALPLTRIADEVAAAPTPILVKVALEMERTGDSMRQRMVVAEPLRDLLHDLTRSWYAGTRGLTKPVTPDAWRSLLTTSHDTELPPLMERGASFTARLTWTAVARSSRIFIAIFVAIVVLETATFAAAFASLHGAAISAHDSLVLATAVLAPPCLVLFGFAALEWGSTAYRRLKGVAAESHLLSIPQVRIVVYLEVLFLAEVSWAAADLLATLVFGAPGSFLGPSGANPTAFVAFLLILVVTIVLFASAVRTWNLGGARRTVWAAATLYLGVFGVFGVTEIRAIADVAEEPGRSALVAVQGLLWDAPVALTVLAFFAGMLFVALAEPWWQEAQSTTARLRRRVAQAYLDDLADHPSEAHGMALDRVSDLGRQGGGTPVSHALRELFPYDVDRDRFVVLRWHDPDADRIIDLSMSGDGSGPLYMLSVEDVATPRPSGTSAAAPTADDPGALWGREDLTDPNAWLGVLRAQKGQGRLSRPPSDARDGPNYAALLTLLTDPSANEARALFQKVGWSRPTGVSLVTQLIDLGLQGQSFTPDVETDGEYLEVELSRICGHGKDPSPYLGPWTFRGWSVQRTLVHEGANIRVTYQASRTTDPSSAG